ncbi:hypothetical protein SAMN05444722_1269 [Rhodovulum sp. ES.010]|uniref:hypothetical protein n=1 Tax=Rhodovulum sp. ES.010 TaxID=1882821 RepID=UPI00092CAA2C|nr:hypothetical protein [Rhodovulum sp. ES.010]SIO29517.1 hypothetical protein SAMN05444722_1269 [Rhodovulum sp. ES.010]
MLSALTYLLAMIGGIAAVVGGVIFLFKQKTVVTQEGQVTDIDIPFLGKVRSNYPSIIVAFIGAAVMIFTVSRVDPTVPTIDLSADVGVAEGSRRSGLPVIIAAVPQQYLGLTTLDETGKGKFDFTVEKTPGTAYNVVVLQPVEVTEDGITRYQSIHGPAQVTEDQKHLIFTGVLR